MRREKKECPVCKTEQVCEEDPTASVESLAYGSNNAGLKFPEHEHDGKRCEGSGFVFQ